MNDIRTRTITELLDCKLTQEEQLERGQQLADAITAVDTEEAAQKTAKDKMKESLAALASEVNRLVPIVHDGIEKRQVSVRIDYDDTSLMVHKTRLDTGELVASRAMTEEERQRALPFVSRKVN